MGNTGSDFVVIGTAQGEPTANIIKAHLESEGIPVLLQYESLGIVYGVTVDGLGQVRILVPRELAETLPRMLNSCNQYIF